MENETRILVQSEVYEVMERGYLYIEAQQTTANAQTWAKGLMVAINL